MYTGSSIGFNAICEECKEYLHSCLNCALYNSDSDRCRSLTTEAVSNRGNRNFCEEFTQHTDDIQGREKSKSAVDFKSLFGTDGE